MKKLFFFNKNFIFLKFLNFYNYKIFIHSSCKNLYCFLFSFFKLNIIFSVSTISLFIRKYIFLNFGKFFSFKVYKFLGFIFSNFILNLNIIKIKFQFNNYNKNINYFFFYLKNIIT